MTQFIKLNSYVAFYVLTPFVTARWTCLSNLGTLFFSCFTHLIGIDIQYIVYFETFLFEYSKHISNLFDIDVAGCISLFKLSTYCPNHYNLFIFLCIIIVWCICKALVSKILCCLFTFYVAVIDRLTNQRKKG